MANGIPFGFGRLPFPAPTDEDLARALARSAGGAPIGFPGAPREGLPADALAQPIPAVGPRPFDVDTLPAPPMADIPDAPASTGSVRAPAGRGTAQRSATPPLGFVPLPPPRPAEFGAGDTPPAPAVPTAPDAPEPARGDGEMSSFLKGWQALARSGIGDQLLAFGSGLLSEPGGAGFGKAFDNMSRAGTQRSAQKLAETELALKQRKLAQETAALGGNAQYAKDYFAKRGQPITDDQAATFGRSNEAMNAIFKGDLPADPQFVQTRDDQGNIWNVDQRTGQQTVALKVEKPEFGEVGVGDGSKRQKAWIARDGGITPVGAPYAPKAGVELTQSAERAEEKSRGEGLGKRYNAIAEDGSSASADLSVVQRAMTLLRNTEPGARTAGLEWLRQQTGLALDPNASNVQAANAALEYMVPRMRVPGSGVTTDRDMETFRNSLGSLKGTPEGNEIAMTTVGAVALNRKERADIASQWQLGQIDAREAQKRMDALPDPFERFKAWESSQGRAGGAGAARAPASAPKEPPQGAPAGARQANDGNWYVPDPNRPGKFLRMQVPQ